MRRKNNNENSTIIRRIDLRGSRDFAFYHYQGLQDGRYPFIFYWFSQYNRVGMSVLNYRQGSLGPDPEEIHDYQVYNITNWEALQNTPNEFEELKIIQVVQGEPAYGMLRCDITISKNSNWSSGICVTLKALGDIRFYPL